MIFIVSFQDENFPAGKCPKLNAEHLLQEAAELIREVYRSSRELFVRMACDEHRAKSIQATLLEREDVSEVDLRTLRLTAASA